MIFNTSRIFSRFIKETMYLLILLSGDRSTFFSSFFIVILGVMNKAWKNMMDRAGFIPCEYELPEKGEKNHDPSKSIRNEFEKNYPKNIFIPIIECLAEVGMRQLYEEAVGTREQCEGKNVVSLGMIHTLFIQPWFHSINRQKLLINVSNKILFNSKIKRKLFHLKVLQCLVLLPTENCKEFKKSLSNGANSIAATIDQNHDLFGFTNSSMYLVWLFFDSLTNIIPSSKNKEHFSQKSLAVLQKSRREQFGAKEDCKLILKDLTKLFNGLPYRLNASKSQRQTIIHSIKEKQQQVQNLFGLEAGIPNWSFFIQIVVYHCYEYKKKKKKVTCTLLGQWLVEFRERSMKCGSQSALLNVLSKEETLMQEKTINLMEMEENFTMTQTNKKFNPIILFARTDSN